MRSGEEPSRFTLTQFVRGGTSPPAQTAPPAAASAAFALLVRFAVGRWGAHPGRLRLITYNITRTQCVCRMGVIEVKAKNR